jgi:hypothetical protein
MSAPHFHRIDTTLLPELVSIRKLSLANSELSHLRSRAAFSGCLEFSQ